MHKAIFKLSIAFVVSAASCISLTSLFLLVVEVYLLRSYIIESGLVLFNDFNNDSAPCLGGFNAVKEKCGNSSCFNGVVLMI